MSTSVQSNKLANIYAELGFRPDLAGRDPKIIRTALNHCRLESLDEETSRKNDSQEAKDLALEFCKTDQNADTFWPDNTAEVWPSWSKDQKKIIELLAHALSLKAYHKYKNSSKDRKKSTLSTENFSIDNNMALPTPRELSPESDIYKETLPKGTRRRPATGPDQKTTVQEAPGTLSQETSKQYVPPMVSNPAPEVNSDFRAQFRAQCIEHIKQLKPKSSHHFFKNIARNWILNPNVVCPPPSVDNKILTLMHDQKVYDPESQDPKLMKLISQLRNGLNLEGLENYHIIEGRVLGRINILARELYDNKILVRSDGATGQYCQAEEFRTCWENKQKYWRDCAFASNGTAEVETPRPETIPTSTAADPSTDADDGLFVGPTPTPPPVAKSMANKAYRTKHTKPKTPKRPAGLEDDYPTPPQTKRTKTARPSGLLGEVPERLFSRSADKGKQPEIQIIEDDDTPVVGPSKISGMASGSIFPKKSIEEEKEIEPEPEEDENMQDAETEEQINFARNFLSAPTTFDKPSSSQPSTPQANTTGNQPMTPTSPTLSVGTLAHESRQRARSKSPAANKLRNTPQTLSPPTRTTRPHPEIFLTLQDKNLKYDIDNPIPITHLKHSSLSNFLGLVSQRSNIPFHEIKSLTFSLIFAREFISDFRKVVRRDSEEEWEALKEKIRRACVIGIGSGMARKERTFEILVDVGELRAIVEEEDYGGM